MLFVGKLARVLLSKSYIVRLGMLEL